MLKVKPEITNVKLLKKHKKDCRAIKHVQDGRWNTAWAFPKEVIFRSIRCDKRGHIYMWHVFICNDPDCPARIAVSNEALCEYVDKLWRMQRAEKLTTLLQEHYGKDETKKTYH